MHVQSVFGFVVASLLLTACGSLQTLDPNAERYLATQQRYESTNCETIPRIYSGVSLDICMAFIGPPREYSEAATRDMLDYYIFDIIFSGIIDTAALPYTIVRQINDGSYQLKNGLSSD